MKKQNLKTHFSTLETTPQPQILKEIKDLILKKYDLEKIIVFGSKINDSTNCSCFLPGDSNNVKRTELSCFSLLIVPSVLEKKADIHIQQRIEEECKPIATVAVIIHRMEEINRALKNGSSFFTTIYNKGIILHDNQVEPFATPGNGEDVAKRLTKKELFWDHRYKICRDFLRGAEFYYNQDVKGLSIFMLHQALQHCYAGMLKVFIGCRISSNSLNRLMTLIETTVPNSEILLSNSKTPYETRLKALIVKGFGDARYDENFNATSNEISELSSRVNKILEKVDNACIMRFKDITEGRIQYIAKPA